MRVAAESSSSRLSMGARLALTGSSVTSEKDKMKMFTEWRDLMFKLDGEMARAVQDQFNALWRQTSGEILAGEKFYPQDIEFTIEKASANIRPGSVYALLFDPFPITWFDFLRLRRSVCC